MLCKDWQCLCPSPLQYTIYYEKSAVFSPPCTYTSPWSISDWSCETKKVDFYENLDLSWRAFCLRDKEERFHHPFTCVAAESTSCGKTEKTESLSSMWSKWWHLLRKESFGVTVSGSGVLPPPVTDCKMVYRLSNTLPALRFRHWKFITEGKTFYVIFKFSSIFVF